MENRAVSYDPLRFTWEPTPQLWVAYYDPEGPSGHGKTQQDALLALICACLDDDHQERMLTGSIVAAISPPARDSSPRCHPAGTLELRDGKMTPVGGPGELQPGGGEFCAHCGKAYDDHCGGGRCYIQTEGPVFKPQQRRIEP
jgi:hypothetical protein